MSFDSLPSFAKQTGSIPVTTPLANNPLGTGSMPDPLSSVGSYSMNSTGWIEVYDDKEADRILFFKHQNLERVEMATGYVGLYFGEMQVDIACVDARTLAQMILAQQISTVRRGENKVTKVIARNTLVAPT